MGFLSNSSVWDTFLFLLVLAYLLYKTYIKHYSQWKALGIFYLKPMFPFGNMYNLVVKRRPRFLVLQDLYKSFKAQGQPYGGFFYMQEPELLIVEPALLKNILISDFHAFTDRGMHNLDFEKEPILRHLFGVDGHDWRPLRQRLSPTFTSAKMKFMFDTVKKCSENLSQHMEIALGGGSGDEVDVRNMCECYTLDVIGSCAYGLEVNCLLDKSSEFKRAAHNIFRTSFPKFLKTLALKVAPRVSQLCGLKQEDTEATDYITELITRNVEERENKNIQRQDFLNLLIELKNNPNPSDELVMTIEVIVSQVYVFFVAGFHTSAVAMSLCLEELALNQDVQDKLREEIYRVTGENGGEVTYQSVKEMPYLDRVAKETLRKYPSLPQLNRRSTQTYTFPGSKTTIPPRTRIIIPVYALHYDPAYYPDPERFDPERFEPDQVEARPSFTYLPFGDGPRNCIGLRFGQLQFKLGLINLISKYEFLLPSKPQKRVYSPDALLIVAENVTLRARKLK